MPLDINKNGSANVWLNFSAVDFKSNAKFAAEKKRKNGWPNQLVHTTDRDQHKNMPMLKASRYVNCSLVEKQDTTVVGNISVHHRPATITA